MALSDASAPLLDPPCYCAAATSTIGTSQPNVLLLFLSDGAPRSWAAATQCTTTTTAAVRCAVFARRPLLLSSPRATVWQNASAWPAWASELACCDWHHMRDRKDGASDRFFCNAHRRVTLTAQYAFLPALARARAELRGEWAAGTLRWLVQLDDDSHVEVDRLLPLLAALPHNERLYVGDFSPRPPSSATDFDFACGGAGTVLSRAAVDAADFGGCASRFSRQCYQSDWMVGRCLRDAGVAPYRNHSCGTCTTPFYEEVWLREALADIRSGSRTCAFSQIPYNFRFWQRPLMDDHPGAKMRQQLCAHIDAHAAVSHRHDYCTAKCRRRPRECRKQGIDPHS